jgi:hypothetical protein
MRMKTFHVDERDVGDEAGIDFLQCSSKNAIIQPRQEDQRGGRCFGNTKGTRDNTEEAIEEEVEIGKDEKHIQIFQCHRFAVPKRDKIDPWGPMSTRTDRLPLQEECAR